MTDFALCRDCGEITTGQMSSDKGWRLNESSEHFDCNVSPLTDFMRLPPPIRNVVLRLGAGVKVRDSDIAMLRLGLNLEDEWTPLPSTVPAAAITSTTSPVNALVSDASTRSPRASRPTSATNAPRVADLFDLLDGAS